MMRTGLLAWRCAQAAVEAAVARREEITPELLCILEDVVVIYILETVSA